MSLSLYDVVQPLLTQHLSNLSHLLEKLQTHTASSPERAEQILSARLAPDMFDLRRQIQIATDHAKATMARLAGCELPSYPDTEKTIEELQARLRRTLDFVLSFTRPTFDGAEDRNVQMVYPWATYDFTGLRFVHYWAIPNFMFHVNMAYAILRQQGVSVGKADNLGPNESP